jgi:amino acid transporter
MGMGQHGSLPAAFAHPIAGQITPGYLGLVAVILVLTNFLHLGAIAAAASATFLTCYLAVFVAAFRLRREIEANGTALVIGFVLMAAVLGAFLQGMVAQRQWVELLILGAAAGLSVLLGWSAAPRVAAVLSAQAQAATRKRAALPPDGQRP